jgi:hypothetical protein
VGASFREESEDARLTSHHADEAKGKDTCRGRANAPDELCSAESYGSTGTLGDAPGHTSVASVVLALSSRGDVHQRLVMRCNSVRCVMLHAASRAPNRSA